MKDKLKALILKGLPNSIIYLQPLNNSEQNFEAIVIDDSFEDLSMLNQQKKVMKLIRSSFEDQLHAFSLKTFSPTRWENQKYKFNIQEEPLV